MSKSKVFVLICIAFCAGVMLGSKFNIARPYVFITAAVFVLIFALLVSAQTFFKKAWIAPLLLFFVCLGVLRIQASYLESQFALMLETKQSLEGVVVKDVDMRQTFQMLTVRPEGYSQNILVTTLKTNKFFYGDKVWLTGRLAEAKEFNDFDYKGYLERQNVYALMKYPKAIVLKTNAGNPVVEKLLALKYIFIAQVNKVLPEPYSSLLLGILIGARKSLPQEIIDNFNTTGTSHIIAISGYNISIIASALGFLVYVFGRKSAFVITLGIILLFVIISGASASVIRAALMGGLLLTSSRIGRLYAITPALCFAAACMILVNPKILYWDAGFQLSFLATAGIVYGLPVLEGLTEKVPRFFGLKTALLITFAAILATLPLVLLLFGRLSVSAPLVNLLVLPAVPPAMFFGFFSALPFFGAGFAFIAQLLLWYILHIIGFFAAVKYSAFDLKLQLWQFYLLYIGLVGVYFLLKHYLSRKGSYKVEKPFSMW